ncbi:MAG: AAA family ATPase, partial [Mycetocola sp.]
MHNLADVSEDQAPRFMAESAALDFVRPLNRPIRLVQPADDTLMANRVSHEPPGGPQPSTANVSRLFGRAHELAAIREHLQAAPRAGSLGFIGETGAGKTALIMSAQQLAIDSNMLVLSARGTPGERPIAFSGLHQLLVPLVGLSATLSPRLRVAIEAALGLEELSRHDPLVLLNAVIALLRSASDTQPLLLAVDDLDLIDDETTQVLASLAHRMPILSTALIWSAAPGKVAPGLNGETMVIGRLDHLDADALVRETAPRLSGYLRRIVIAEGAGNPLALKALARARDDSLAPRPCKVGMDALPAVALAPFIAALDRLTHQASQGLLLVALERRGAMPVLLRAGVGAEELEELDASRLCRIDTASLSIAFTHPLTRFVVTNRADIAQRRQGHLALAGVLSDTPEEQAFHLAEAAIDSDEATADLLESAGRAAAERGDTSAAVQALLRAAQLSPSRSRARRRRAESDFLAIQVVDDNARRQFADDLERLPRRGPGAMYAAVVLAYKRLGENISVVAACDLIRDAVLRERQSWSADNGELVNALTGWLNLLWVAGRDDRWEAFFEVLCKLEPAPPEPLATIAAVSADPAHTSPAQRERIVELLSNDGPWTLPATTAALCSDRLAPIIPASAGQIEKGRRSGHTRTSLGALVAVALQDFSAGRWDRALALADEAEAGLRGAPEDVISAMVTYLRALISVCRGDEARSSELLGQMVDISIRTGAVGIGRLERRVRALASCAKGAWEEAFRHAAALQAPGDF